MKVSIIGLGHIGGSLALNLKEKGFATYIYGHDADGEAMESASRLGLIDEQVQPEVAVGIADLVILAIPVDQLKKQLPYLLDFAHEGTVITDMGSTKLAICDEIRSHQNRVNFVASHPIAGREVSGPDSAIKGLFEGKTTIIVEKESSALAAVESVENMYRTLGMHILYMDAEEHDIHLAYISHVSHISSFSLALSVLNAEKDEKRIFQFAGSGFDSTARLAKSSPEMWAPIFLENKVPLMSVLDKYIEILTTFKDNIINNNREGLVKQMAEANEIQRILEGKFAKSSKTVLKE
jgi:prephenate dehydrogenase